MAGGNRDEALRWLALYTQNDTSKAWTWPWFYLAILYAEKGDIASFTQHCQTMLARFGETQDWMLALRLAIPCSLLPLGEFELAKVRALVAIAPQIDHEHVELAVAMSAYRRSEFAAVIERCRDALRKPPLPERDAQLWCLLAMAHYRLGHRPEASRALAEAIRLANDRSMIRAVDMFKHREWFDWVLLAGGDVLLREATALVRE